MTTPIYQCLLRLMFCCLLLIKAADLLADESTARDYCKGLNPGVEQSACYDELERMLRDAPLQESLALQIDNWAVRSQESSEREENDVFLFLPSSDNIPFGLSTTTPTLVIRCLADTTNLYIDFDADLRSVGVKNDSVQVVAFIEGSNSAEENWTLSKDKRAIFPTTSYIDFAKSLVGKSNFSITLTPDEGPEIQMGFALQGLEAALTPLRSSCHWSS